MKRSLFRMMTAILLAVCFVGTMFLVACNENKPATDEKTDEGPFTVEWVDYDGTGIAYSKDVPAGTTPVFNGKEPTRDGYVFDGWDPEPGPIHADAKYTAKYRELTTRVTASEFAGALALEGNLTLTSSLFGIPFKYYQLEDGSFETIGPVEGEMGALLVLKQNDGTYTMAVSAEFASDGTPLFGEVNTISRMEYDLYKAKGCVPMFYTSLVKYSDLTYDESKNCYSGTIDIEGDSIQASFSFENKQLVSFEIGSGITAFKSKISDVGKTILPDKESFLSGARGCVATLDGDDYEDQQIVTLTSHKAGSTYVIDSYVDVAELPGTFDPSKDKINYNVGVIRAYEDGENGSKVEELGDEYVSMSFEVLPESGKEFTLGGKASLSEGSSLMTQLTKTEGGKNVAVGIGKYRVKITLTLKKDLPEGNDSVVVYSALQGPKDENEQKDQPITLSLKADGSNGYDIDSPIRLDIKKKDESVDVKLTATFEVPSNYDPTIDRFCIDAELVDKNDVYYSNDEYSVTMTYDGRSIAEYMESSYKYRGRLTKSADSDVSLDPGTYEIGINLKLLSDLQDKDLSLIVTISCYE